MEQRKKQEMDKIMQETALGARREANENLAPASQAAAKARTLYMIGNAHIDPVWLWQWQEGFQEVKATFRSALDLMKEYNDFVFVSSSAAYYAWVERSDPQMFAEIRQRVTEGRWAIVGGWWIQPDCNIPSGESFVRQGLIGQRYFQEKLGVKASVGYNVDSFGHHGMLPQILQKSGLDSYVFLRPSPHEKGLPGRLFWWESDDGARVLGYRIPFEYGTWGKDLEEHVRRVEAELRPPVDRAMAFYGVGNHGGGPTRQNLESIRRMNARDDFPRLVFSSPERYFESVRENEALRIPVVHDDLQHHAIGCYSAHSGVKRWNRQAENLLLAAEKFSAIATWKTGLPYPDFSQAWKNVLFNQFHDILAGTSLEAAYDDARDTYGEAMAIAGRNLNEAIQALAWNIRVDPVEGMIPIHVFNPHAWPSRASIEMESSTLKGAYSLVDDEGRHVPFQIVCSQATAKGRCRLAFVADLPALGYRTYRLLPASPDGHPAGADALNPAEAQGEKEHPDLPILASDSFMENDRFRLEIDLETGALRSLYDKQAETELLADLAALPVVLDDPSDTWSHNVFRYDQVVGTFKAARIRLVEWGPVKAIVRVTSEWGRSRLMQDFTLYSDLDQIDVAVTVDWHEHFKVLKLRFPLNLSNMRAVSEIPYGHIEREASGDEEPGQSWLDLSGLSRATGRPYGLSLLNDGKYSYDVNVRDIGMTVLRSPIYAHHMPVVPDPEGDYGFIDQGVQRFHYTLLPHQGSWEEAGTVRRAAELNGRPIALAGAYRPDGRLPQCDSYLSASPENIVVSMVKLAEEGDDLVIRAVETSKSAVRARISLPHWQREIAADFGPCEIKTFRVPRDPGLPVRETNLLEE